MGSPNIDAARDPVRPLVPLMATMEAGTADQQPAHAVADQDQVLHRLGPLLDQCFQRVRQRLAVTVNGETGVVTQAQGVASRSAARSVA